MKEKILYALLIFNLFIGMAGVIFICRMIPALESYGTLFGVIYFIQFIWFLDSMRKTP
jgi:hypothetical protein